MTVHIIQVLNGLHHHNRAIHFTIEKVTQANNMFSTSDSVLIII
ncbi:hypothetical protein JL09_g6259 [Pichia kudriavzevii]|uniref:Uncharacterized protein n=2 Tax=Pichia kudriavzevii TaxID=4909 RepID=A0A099NP75_PICKU|nr:hypothetical protein JL09_g6259 [Pichia kudriavzevii]